MCASSSASRSGHDGIACTLVGGKYDLPHKEYVNTIFCPLELVKLGVATNPDPSAELQIESPVPLELAGHYAMSDRPTAEAVVAALQERFAARCP